jgi:DNA replicative helicase MCM subunit Mcm2 (Cdc46/Mcm family)
MEVIEMIEVFSNFFQEHQEILVSAKGKSVQVDFRLISVFNFELAKELLMNPEDAIRSGEIAIEQLTHRSFILRLSNVVDSVKITIGAIRAHHIDRLIKLCVGVKSKSDVRPLIVAIKYECPSCGNIINVLQLDSKIKDPSRCGCGRKGSFRKLSKEMVDSQKVMVSDNSGRKIEMLIKSDLVDRKLEAGKRYIITGIVRDVIKTVGQSQSTTLELMIDTNNIESAVGIK